jgi:aspartate/methionine/tyrosine aminotransferase
MRKEDWLKILPILERYPETPILLDEAFFEIIFDWQQTNQNSRYHTSLLHIAPHILPRIMCFRSGTKALALSGERMAVTFAGQQFIGSLTAFQSRLLGNSPIIHQAAMAKALETQTRDKLEKISNYYQQSMAKMWQGLTDMNLIPKEIPKPEGCFYTLADFSFLRGKTMPDLACQIMEKPNGTTIATDMQLVMSLLAGLNQPENAGIAMMPACCFGLDENKLYTRLSASVSTTEIEKALARVGALKY